MASVPPQGNFFVRRYKSAIIYIKKWLTSDPSISVMLVAVLVFIISFIPFWFFNNGVGNSISFGVTNAALFVALMIFRIQAYTKPLCSLFIEPLFRNNAFEIEISLSIENIGTSLFKSHLLKWNISSEILRIGSELFIVEKIAGYPFMQNVEIPKQGLPHTIAIFRLRTPITEEEKMKTLDKFLSSNQYIKSSKIFVEMKTKGFLLNYIFGNMGVYFASEDVQTALEASIINYRQVSASWCNTAGPKMPPKIERVWQYQSRIDGPPLG